MDVISEMTPSTASGEGAGETSFPSNRTTTSDADAFCHPDEPFFPSADHTETGISRSILLSMSPGAAVWGSVAIIVSIGCTWFFFGLPRAFLFTEGVASTVLGPSTSMRVESSFAFAFAFGGGVNFTPRRMIVVPAEPDAGTVSTKLRTPAFFVRVARRRRAECEPPLGLASSLTLYIPAALGWGAGDGAVMRVATGNVGAGVDGVAAADAGVWDGLGA